MSRKRPELALALELALGDRLAALAAAFDLAAGTAMFSALDAGAVPAVEAGAVAIALFWSTALLSDHSGGSGGGR
jgi:hypothetical protein